MILPRSRPFPFGSLFAIFPPGLFYEKGTFLLNGDKIYKKLLTKNIFAIYKQRRKKMKIKLSIFLFLIIGGVSLFSQADEYRMKFNQKSDAYKKTQEFIERFSKRFSYMAIHIDTLFKSTDPDVITQVSYNDWGEFLALAVITKRKWLTITFYSKKAYDYFNDREIKPISEIILKNTLNEILNN
jgi:hypothetical protein